MSIRRRGQRAYQVRVAPFPAKTLPTKEAAVRYELDLLLRRSLGDRHLEESRTLGQELDAWIARRRAAGGNRDRTLEFYERSAKIWATFRAAKLSDLRRAPVEDFIAARASEYPRSASNELELLKRVLRDARGRGQRVDEGVLSIPPVRHRAREGRALTVEELNELASWFPEHSKRLVLLAGMVGARQRVWFGLTNDLLDLERGTMEIPPALSKNRRAHRIYLTDLEAGLFREQLLARSPGTSLVFPTPTARAWTRSGFRERVWLKATAAAAAHDSAFENFDFHLLRHTAGSLMARAGMDPAAAAERMGHSDGGALFLRTYRHLYESEKRSQARLLESLVRRHLDDTWTEPESESDSSLNEAESDDGRTWDRTRDLPRVKQTQTGSRRGSPACFQGYPSPRDGLIPRWSRLLLATH
jgi:integrase